MNDKKAIRKNIIAKRKSLSNHEFVTKSSLICKKIVESKIYNDSNVIYCYSSINNEVDLQELMNDILKQEKILGLPKVIDKDLVFYQVNDFKQLKEGYFNILEPVECKEAPTPDLVITPGVAFTKDGNRLGYGGGFYDRFFNKNKSVYKLGVAFDFQILEELPLEEHDVVLDEIIYN